MTPIEGRWDVLAWDDETGGWDIDSNVYLNLGTGIKRFEQATPGAMSRAEQARFERVTPGVFRRVDQ